MANESCPVHPIRLKSLPKFDSLRMECLALLWQIAGKMLPARGAPIVIAVRLRRRRQRRRVMIVKLVAIIVLAIAVF